MPTPPPQPARRPYAPAVAALCGLGVVLTPPTAAVSAQPVEAIEVQEAVVVQQAVEVQRDIAIALEEPIDPMDEILGPDFEPGFQVQRGEHREDLDEAINAFHTHLDQQEWEKAFRQLIALTDSTRHIMAPMNDSPIYRPIRRSIQERLLSLPLEGRRAFQQFYDAQAREMLARAREHPRPGSDEQVRQVREVFELFLLTSSGDAAADLLGDLYFERGEFEQAQACWQAVLEHHPATSIPEVGLLFKRAIALHRAGQAHEAHALAEQIARRFAGREVAYAGGRADASATLRGMLGAPPEREQPAFEPGATVPAGLPAEGDLPLWQVTFADDATAAQVNGSVSRNHYYGPTDLRLLLPPTAADDHAVYAHWHGVAFAMDLDSGKLLWRTGRFNEAARTLQQRMGSAAGTPRGYKIALGDRLVLVQSAGQVAGSRAFDRFTLTAYDKATGDVAWDTGAMPEWRSHSFCGQPLVVRGQAYVITHPVGAPQREGEVLGDARSLTLHRIDTATGQRQWSLPLGDADVQANPYIEFVWMPQPTMLLDGRTLYVLTNNGALLAVDTGAAEVAWAARLAAPEGLGNNQRNLYNIQPPTANAQGAGALYLRDGVLYAKEARGGNIYALDPQGPAVLWECSADNPDAEFIGLDDDRLFVMSQRIRAIPLPGRDVPLRNNNQIGGPSVGSALFANDTLYALGGNKLHALSLDNLDPTANAFTSRYLRGSGGFVLMAGDKLICVTQRDITAFRVPAQPAPAADTRNEPGDQP